MINYLERSGSKLVYNPGTYQLKNGVKKEARLLSLVYLLIVNLEEAKVILGCDKSSVISSKKLLQELADLGPRNIIITDGKNGLYGYDGDRYYHLPVFPADLKEMTGAGDACSTAILAALFYGESLKEAMRWGAANSASVVEKVGPQNGLLSYDQLQSRLIENSRIVAKEIV